MFRPYLTKVEHELIVDNSELPGEVQNKWLDRVRLLENENQRVELARNLKTILEQEHHGSLAAINPGNANFLTRLSEAAVLAGLPQELGVNGKQAEEVMRSANPSEALEKLLLEKLGHVIGAKTLSEEGKRALGNPEYLKNLFLYHSAFEKGGSEWSRGTQQLDAFKGINKAFLESGVKGAKDYKYRGEKAREVIKDAQIPTKLVSFLEGLDSSHRVTTEAGGEGDLYDAFEQKLADYAGHLKEENPLELLEKAGKEAAPAREKANEVLARLPKEFSDAVAAAIKTGDYEKALAITREKTGLSKTNARIANALIPHLKQLIELGELGKGREAVEAAQRAVAAARSLEKLRGKPWGEQTRALEQAGRGLKQEHLDFLRAMPKSVFRDLAFFAEQALKPPQRESSGLETHVTHAQDELFTLGKFQNNCQSPGTTQSVGLPGFAGHPTELTLGHYADGEFVGFTFAHLTHAPNGKFALVIERPYTNHQGLHQSMTEHLQEFKERVAKAAEKQGVPLTVYLQSEAKDKGLHTIETHLPKWYDVTGGKVDAYTRQKIGEG
ncbi:MAG: hypothetical protein WC607_02390 [Candidatus Micrarchaeia archaeon]